MRGLLHDMSKFSPVEFFEGVKYYQGGKGSPINACKAENGYSMAWFHHKGRNKHHYEYWVDSLDKGGIPVQMPYKYAVEMICDYLAAGRVYMGKDFTYEKEYEWFTKKDTNKFHPQTNMFVGWILGIMAHFGIDWFEKDYLKDCYKSYELIYRDQMIHRKMEEWHQKKEISK